MRRPSIVSCLFLALLLAGHASAQTDPEPSGPVPPRLIEAPQVMLPEGAAPLPADSSVLVELTIDADGAVIEAEVIESPREDVEALVLDAVRAARFAPATRDGEAIPARVRFRYRIATRQPEPAVEPVAQEAPSPDETAPSEEPPPEETPPEEAIAEDTGPELGVTANVDAIESNAATRITLRGAELTTVPGTFGDPVRVVAALPGVARSPFGLGYFLVRGANFQNTGYLIDGFPVPALYHLGAGPSVLHARLVSRLHFYPGGYPVSYGRYTAGVVALETMPPEVTNFRAEVQFGGYLAGVLMTIPLPENLGTLSLSIRRSYYDLIVPLYSEIYGRSASDFATNPFAGINFAYTDYSLRAELRVHSRLQASIFLLGSDDWFDQRGSFAGGSASEGARTNLGYDFQRLIMRLTFRLDDGARFTVSGMLGRNGNRFDSARPGRGDLSFSQETYVAGLRVEGFVPWSENLRTRIGIDVLANLYDLEATLPTPPGFGEYPRPTFDPQLLRIGQTIVNETAALYLEQIFDFDPIEVSLGGRFELMRHGTRTDPYPDPRLVARWRIVPELTMKVASGLFTQPPNAYSSSARFGNPDLPAERSWQSSVGVEATLPEAIQAHLTGYYTRFFQLTRSVDDFVTDENGDMQRLTSRGDGEGQAYGLEVLLRRQIAQGLFGWVSYTLSRSERFVAGGTAVPFQFDQTHVLNFAVSYAFDGWRFGARFQLATGPWTTRIDGGAYDADGNSFSPYRRGLTERLPTYHRLDVRVDRFFTIGPLAGSIFVDIQNVYNAPSAEGVLYQYDFRAASPLPGLPILPSIGVQFAWEPGVTEPDGSEDEDEDEHEEETEDEEEEP